MTDRPTLSCTLDRFDNGQAVLEFGNRQTLTIARRYLPKDAKEGLVLQVELLTDRLATKRRENLAKAILEEILNGE